VLDILVTEVGLKSAGVVPLVGQCVATGMPEHVLKPASKLLSQCTANVADGSIATDTFSASSGQCPLWSNNDLSRHGSKLTLCATSGCSLMAEKIAFIKQTISPAESDNM